MTSSNPVRAITDDDITHCLQAAALRAAAGPLTRWWVRENASQERQIQSPSQSIYSSS